MMKQDAAETVALQALGWLAANEDLMPTFMGATGASAEDLRTQAGDPVFLGAVLDFIMMDDAWVTGLCDTINVPYDRIILCDCSKFFHETLFNLVCVLGYRFAICQYYFVQ